MDNILTRKSKFIAYRSLNALRLLQVKTIEISLSSTGTCALLMEIYQIKILLFKDKHYIKTQLCCVDNNTTVIRLF